jgi:hypothetical protein
MTTKFKVVATLYGGIWLYIMSPFIIFVILGSTIGDPVSNFTGVVQTVLGTIFYWCCMWMPVRKKMYKYDKWFCENVVMVGKG